MRSTLISLALAASTVDAYASMGRLLADVKRREVLQTRSTSLLGDLVSSVTTAVGSEIQSILTGAASAIGNSETYTPPGGKDSAACKKDTCCIWSFIVADMVQAFTDGDACSSTARGAVRLGFHDAGAWNSTLSFGGADGSILLSGELSRPENNGLGPIADQTNSWFNTYKKYGISMADLIQVGATTATVVCPLGPRIKTFVGRKDSTQQPPKGLLPSPFQEAPELIELFAAKTFTPSDLVALVGAHTVSQQFFVDKSKAGAPQDSTDGVWDVAFYGETASSSTPPGVFKFPSDISLSQNAVTKPTWNQFSGNGGQGAWDAAYAPAYFRMSLLGVKNLNDLTDCTKVLPLPRN